MILRILLLCLVFSCSSEPEGPFLLLDTRATGKDQKRLPVSSLEQKYMMISFSGAQDFSPPQYGYKIGFTSQATQIDSSPTTSLKVSSFSFSQPALQRLLKKTIQENERNQRFHLQTLEAFKNLQLRPQLFKRFSQTNVLTANQVEDSITIFSPFESEQNQPIQGILRASSDTTAVYVDSRINDLISEKDTNDLLHSYDQISLPRLKTLFGEMSDIDQNHVVRIFIAPPEKLGSDVLGFFRPLDLLPDGSVNGIKSNEGEILYIRNLGEEDFPKELANATIAHETYHLINFAQKTLPIFQQTNGWTIISESLFLNEGLAHLAEELTGWGTSSSVLAKIYLDCMEYSSLAGSGNSTVAYPCAILQGGEDSLPRRGGAMLFLLYLFQQMGGATYSSSTAGDVSGPGADFLKTLTKSNEIGIRNIEQATGRDFFSLYKDFVSMLALDNTNLSSDSKFNLQPEETDSFTQLARNFRLRMTRTTSEGTLTLNGPKVLEEIQGEAPSSIERSLYVSGANAFKTTIPAGFEFQITLEAERSLGLGMILIPLTH